MQVDVSVDDGPWTEIGHGAFVVPDYFFLGGAVLPDGSLTVRVRARAMVPYADGFVRYSPSYADLQPWYKHLASVFDVPTDCVPIDPPGTGTPGYWKNHPEAWPTDEIELGGWLYTLDEAIDILNTPIRGDKSYSLAHALISATLNVDIGNPSSCIDDTIAEAHEWLTVNELGSNVRGNSRAWRQGGDDLLNLLDAYNNGELCNAGSFLINGCQIPFPPR